MTSTITTTADVYARASRMAERLSDALAAPAPTDPNAGYGPRSPRWWDQSLSKGAAGVAVLHAARGRPDLAEPWLARAVQEDISAAPGCGLWFGAPAVAFAVLAAGEHRHPGPARELRRAVKAVTGRRLAAAQARIDAGVRPSRAEFDLVRGLSGLGAHLLGSPSTDEQDLLFAVLTHLVRLTLPLPVRDTADRAAPGWWTTDVLSGPDPLAGGHADNGMAHGISGPLALLSLAALRDVRVAGQLEAIERICAWLDRWRQPGPSGPWWPQRIALSDLQTGQVTTQEDPGRPSWCYGTPGLARAQQLAGLALGDRERQGLAERALLDAVTDPGQLGGLSDLSLCHGWAGVIVTVWCAAADARHPGFDAVIPALLDHLLAATDDPTSGEQPVGLIGGAAGVALTLHTVATDAPRSWARCMLLA